MQFSRSEFCTSIILELTRISMNTSGGSIVNYCQFKTANEEHFGSIVFQKFVEAKESFKFPDGNFILPAWQVTNEALFKCGEKRNLSLVGVQAYLRELMKNGKWYVFMSQVCLQPSLQTI